jgi:hypothetical protein
MTAGRLANKVAIFVPLYIDPGYSDKILCEKEKLNHIRDLRTSIASKTVLDYLLVCFLVCSQLDCKRKPVCE